MWRLTHDTWTWSLRGPFSPCRDRAQCRPRVFRNGDSVVTIEKTESRAIARISPNAKNWRTIDDPGWFRGALDWERIGDFSASRDADIRHWLFLLLHRTDALGVANDDTAERIQAFQICSVKGKLLRLCKKCQARGIGCGKTVPINSTFARVLSF